ncbi:hypothetical protein ACFOEZ_10160 [Tianweitania populi]|uniref:Uncharacterized protein n=1 Tax=Tianweitania populi TaxID=1607949 RepID=A0A8J3DZG1_9HYPH|nr:MULTISPECIES: hypothetical protein [Tianweitania]GHD24384.1 hypothetical protein GCM10016234_40530 [Tianweitania populi]
MNQAWGLIAAVPALLVMIAFMYRQGAMPGVGAIAAAGMTIVIGALLFWS